MDALDALKSNHPLIGLLLEIFFVGLLAAATWFVFSILFAVLYCALKNALVRAAVYLQSLAQTLLMFGRAAWKHSSDAIDSFVQQLTLKWVFVEQDAIIGQRIALVRDTVNSVSQRIENGLGEMRTSMDSFRGAVETLAVPVQGFENTIGQASSEQIRDAARNRRTALVELIISAPVLLILVALNTTMLTKFFESFVDEWLSFRWGIKLSTVLGLFFSVLEVTLGILLYSTARSKDPRSIVPALKQLLYLALIGSLALIETYLYHRLSLEMSPDRAGSALGDGLPAWVHGSWLALLGPVLVIALSAMGHELISAINKFVDAGLEKSQQKILEEMRRTWTAVMKSGTDLQRRLSEVKGRCTEFLNGLTGTNDPNTAVGTIENSLSRLIDALDSARQARLHPYARTDEAEARRTFALLTLKAAALVIVTILFCAVQFMYTPAGVLPSMSAVLISGAIVQAAAVSIAAYKIHSHVVLVIEGQPAEVLQGSRETWTTAIAATCFLAVVAYNAALAGAFLGEPFQWIPFLLAMVCVTAFALIGRTIPAVGATAKVWVKVAGAAIIALVAWACSLACWLAKVVCRGVKALLYVLAYPFFLVFLAQQTRAGRGTERRTCLGSS